MFTHDQIWTAVDRLAQSRGLSASGLAKQAGLDATAFNKSKRISPNGKPRWPSTESLSKILAVTDCTMSDLLTLMDKDNEPARQLPLHMSSGLKNGKLKDKTKATFPASFSTGENSFAITIEDNSLQPLFRSGSTLIADTKEKIKKDDRVLFHTKSGLKAGIVQSADKKGLTVDDTAYADSDIEWAAKILWASQ